jgi:hypothetical protein
LKRDPGRLIGEYGGYRRAEDDSRKKRIEGFPDTNVGDTITLVLIAIKEAVSSTNTAEYVKLMDANSL